MLANAMNKPLRLHKKVSQMNGFKGLIDNAFYVIFNFTYILGAIFTDLPDINRLGELGNSQ